MIPFEVKPCRTKAGFDALPKGEVLLSLTRVSDHFGSLGSTDRVMVTEIEGVQILVHMHGKITFKSCMDVALVKRVAASIFEIAIQDEIAIQE